MLPGKQTPSTVAAVLLSTLSVAAAASTTPPAETSAEEQQKILYSIGLALSRSLANYGLTSDEVTQIQRGLADGVLQREPAVDLEQYGPRIEGFLAELRGRQSDKEKVAGAAFRDAAAKQEGAVALDAGVVYFEQLAGSGAQPAAADTVRVHYRGTLRDGQLFDTSMREGGEPATFALSGVVPCFAQGIQRMRVGGKAKLVCPPDQAYGDRGFPPAIPPGATLVFELELLEIVGGGTSPTPAP
jgi:FKBP-type peptidyl-prolyl cis-trans isomerase